MREREREREWIDVTVERLRDEVDSRSADYHGLTMKRKEGRSKKDGREGREVQKAMDPRGNIYIYIYMQIVDENLSRIENATENIILGHGDVISGGEKQMRRYKQNRSERES